MPSSKIWAAGFAAAVGTITVWVLRQYAHTEIPDPVAAAGVTILTMFIGWLVPDVNPADSSIKAVANDAANAVKVAARKSHRAAPPAP